jgi:hypothetical protein
MGPRIISAIDGEYRIMRNGTRHEIVSLQETDIVYRRNNETCQVQNGKLVLIAYAPRRISNNLRRAAYAKQLG